VKEPKNTTSMFIFNVMLRTQNMSAGKHMIPIPDIDIIKNCRPKHVHE
jgi:hypothetical protein